jgi:hypothetical protein
MRSVLISEDVREGLQLKGDEYPEWECNASLFLRSAGKIVKL